MTIELLTQTEYDTLIAIQELYPKLTFQNVGFQYINRDSFSEADKLMDNMVKEILSQHIKGFVKFDNFRIGSDRISQKTSLCVRFQYHWDADLENSKVGFTGVGYLPLDELLNGFAAETETANDTE